LTAKEIQLKDLDELKRVPLLGLRLLALASELGRPLEAVLLEALSQNPALVMRAAREEQRVALSQLLLGAQPARGLRLLQRTGMLPFLLPEVSALVDFHRSSRFHHKDIWQHSCQVVSQIIPREELRWAALLHDIGKVHTRSFTSDRRVHFLRHELLGALMFEGIAARFRFPKAQTSKIQALIAQHLRAQLYQPQWTDSALRRFEEEVGALLPDLFALSRADVTSRRRGRRRAQIFRLHELRGRLRDLKIRDEAKRSRLPKGLGNLIISELGVKPGPEVGRLRDLCERAVKEGLLENPEIPQCIAFLRLLAE